MGGRKSYNPKNRGKKSYQPILTFSTARALVCILAIGPNSYNMTSDSASHFRRYCVADLPRDNLNYAHVCYGFA
jgi:hypothetical protein